jgi:ATP-dependent Clp protease ATP-binding subunit ClpC
MASEDPYLGTLVKERYSIEKLLGRGGFGRVYLARDQQLLSKKVVVKILFEDKWKDQWVMRKFSRGIEALSRVDHPGVVRALDIGQLPDGSPFLVMDFVDGIQVEDIIKPDGVDLDRVANIIRQAGQALSAAHEKGVFHCDLKPANMMLQKYGDGEEIVRLVDFDVAKVVGSALPGETTGVIAGTMAYMAPERFQGKQTAASDTYALGVIAYELVTGRRPFNPEQPLQLIAMQQAGVVVRPRDLRPSLPVQADQVIVSALAYDAEERPKSSREFGDELSKALMSASESPAPPSQQLPRVKPDSGQTALSHSKLQIAHVLFLELVGHSGLPVAQQVRLLEVFEQLIAGGTEFNQGQATNQLIVLSSGAGRALVFFRDPLAPVQCAMEVAQALKDQPEMKVRMGIHTGPVYRGADLNLNRNLPGGGIAGAQMAMDNGDPGHILLTQSVADFLIQVGGWIERLHDLGERKAKEGRLHLYNLFDGEVGNPFVPGKRRPRRAAKPIKERPVPHEPATAPDVAAESPIQIRRDIVSDPPVQSIVTQIVGVSHRRDDKGKEGLIYALVPLAGADMAPEPVFTPAKAQILQAQVQEVRRRVEDLTRRALVGQARGNIGIEEVAGNLARQALPSMGFVGLMGEGVHPQLDLVQDAASEIPWEVLEEVYFQCPRCHAILFPEHVARPGAPHCSSCGERMRRSGGKLALRYHITHLVRGRGRPAGEGRVFLFIEDPSGDLCLPEKDPAGICAQHLEELHKIVETHGFTINLLRRSNATVQRVLRAISDPALAGIYYFGHGFFPRDGDEGRLVLSDGMLFASQIEEAGPSAKLVFLNACEGAATGRDWDLEKRSRSVAHAFARGGRGKVVIAPIWPVVNVQAAETAIEFFRSASPSRPLAEALAGARKMSFSRYESGEPHVAWMAYRYFGDPNNTLPASAEHLLAAQPGETKALPPRVFDAKSRLNTEVFSFAVEEVLIRAARRRNLQDRTQVNVTDFVGGLIRKGDLTRWLLRQAGAQPDELYEALMTGTTNSELPDADEGDEGSLREALSRWIVRKKEEFAPDLIGLLEEADLGAQQGNNRSGDRRISEHDVLELLTANGRWRYPLDIDLPSAAALNARLSERAASARIDENGAISLDGLERDARRIIESAHTLSQQRGMFPISHRLLFAAMLEGGKGHAARVCRCVGVDPELVFVLMIAATEASDEERSPQTFGLSTEACQRIVLPVLEAAAKLAGNHTVTERDLFRAFCERATPEFKAWLDKPPLPVDLDQLGQVDPDREEVLAGLDLDARKIVETAHALAQERGAFPISNRLLLAAFLMDPRGGTAQLLQQNQVPTSRVYGLLVQSAQGGPKPFPLNGAACEKAVTPVIERARAMAAETKRVTERTLFKAFCVTAPVEFKEFLGRQLRIDLDALGSDQRSAAEACVPTSPSPATIDGGQGDVGGLGVSMELFDEDARRALTDAKHIARQLGWAEIRTPHLFVALLAGESRIKRSFEQNQVPIEDLKSLILSATPPQPPLDASTPISLSANALGIVRRASELATAEKRARATRDDLAAAFFENGGGMVGQMLQSLGLLVGEPSVGVAGQARQQSGAGGSALAKYGVDLTERARRGELPEIVGRDIEISTALETLLLTENANPLLVGDAGVGKTAIVEGIAQRIVRPGCPKKLEPMRVIELSAGRLVANTRLRGEFEQRVQDVLTEARSGVILFIDEIHTIVGAGSAEGSGPDAGNMLKTALARGEVRLIGATTHAEYKRTIARDGALARRFQTQLIGPPSRGATIEILSSRQSRFEQQHGVKILSETKEAAVDLSGRYILDKQWPAKARDVLERACVLAMRQGPVEGQPVVTPRHVAAIIARQTGIPLDRISSGDLAALENLEAHLTTRILGQETAIKTVGAAIKRGRQGLAGPNRPWGVFLFVGPPGVGKTELAKVIAEQVYGGLEGLIRFDMADFSEPHSTARLIGAPPGYVGYDQGSPLVEKLRRQPYSLVLFDEIEHAHENVLGVLLRLLSEGTIVDHDGVVADARNTVIIMTSNLLNGPQEGRRIGFTDGGAMPPGQASQSELRGLLERRLPGKLIDRLDAIVAFNPLRAADLEAITALKVGELGARVRQLCGASVEVSPAALRWLAEKAARESQGARHIQRTIDEFVSPVLMAAISPLSADTPARLELALLPDGSGVECIVRRTAGK